MKQKDSAVSEVVGVLLLITITLILVSLAAVAMNSAVGSSEKSVSANIVATKVSNGNITFENTAGDSFSLGQIELRLGIREKPSLSVTLNSSYLFSYSGSDTIGLGDRFRVESEHLDEISWGEFKVNKSEHLTYRFYDRISGSPVASGDILIP